MSVANKQAIINAALQKLSDQYGFSPADTTALRGILADVYHQGEIDNYDEGYIEGYDAGGRDMRDQIRSRI